MILVTSHNGLGEGLTEQFGQHAHRKSVPAWALTLPAEWRKALLDGYLFGDGTYDSARNQYRFATVSKALAIGMRLLALSLGHACTLRLRPGGRIEAINGIEFTRKDQYWGSFIPEPIEKRAFKADHSHWFRVNSLKPGQQAQALYDLSVEGDGSYIADGLIVQNHTLTDALSHRSLI